MTTSGDIRDRRVEVGQGLLEKLWVNVHKIFERVGLRIRNIRLPTKTSCEEMFFTGLAGCTVTCTALQHFRFFSVLDCSWSLRTLKLRCCCKSTTMFDSNDESSLVTALWSAAAQRPQRHELRNSLATTQARTTLLSQLCVLLMRPDLTLVTPKRGSPKPRNIRHKSY